MSPQSPVRRLRFSLEQVTIWALAAALFFAALLVIPSAAFPAIPTKAFIIAAGAIVTLALYILARLARGNVILPPPMLLAALWLPALAYLLSAVFAGVPFGTVVWGSGLATDSLAFILAISLLGTLAALSIRRPEHYRLILRLGAWFLGLVIVVEALVVLVGQVAPNTISPAFSIVGSSRDLAAILGLSVVAILLALRSLELTPRAGTKLLAGGAIALALLAVLNSTLIWVLVALAALALFVEAIMTRRPQIVAEIDLEDATLVVEDVPESAAGSRPFLVPLVVLAISIFFLIGGTLGSSLATVLHTGTLDVRPSWQATLATGRRVYATSPLFGSGPATFASQWTKYRDASLNSTIFWNLDFGSGIGFIPTSFVTTGLVGALAWIVLIGSFLFYGGRMLLMRTPEDPIAEYTATLAFVAALFLFAAAIFELPGPVVLALLFIALGLFVSTTRYARGASQRGVVFARAPRVGFVIVFALTLLLLASVAIAYALIERYVAVSELSSAGAAYAAGNLGGADAAVARSLSFAPLPESYELQAALAGARLSQIISATDMPKADAQKAFQTALSAGINAALTATQLSPNDYQGWVALGNLYGAAVPLGVSGAYDSAKGAYQKALALNPTSAQLYYALAQLDAAHKDNKAAESDLGQALTLKSDYTQAIFLLSQLEVADGNVKDALAAAEAAAYFTPNNPNILFQVGILRAASGDFAGATTALSASVAASPSFANARYFLAAVYARQKDYPDALAQIDAVAALSPDNAKAVESIRAALASGKNPFPANLLSVPPPRVGQ